MAIKSVKLENFTVFETIECEFTPGINVFIGENGTGKTHLLKALYAFCSASTKFSTLAQELSLLFNSNPPIKMVLNRDPSKDVKLQANVNGKLYNYDSGYVYYGEQIDTELFSTFIPAKEMLSISNITRIDERFDRELAIDKSLVNIIKKAQSMKLSDPPELAKKVAPKLESIIGGTVFIKESDLTFWIRKTTGEEILLSV